MVYLGLRIKNGDFPWLCYITRGYIEESQQDHSSLSPPLQEGAFGTNLGQGFVHLAGTKSGISSCGGTQFWNQFQLFQVVGSSLQLKIGSGISSSHFQA